MINVPLYNALCGMFGQQIGVQDEDDPGSYSLGQRKASRFNKKAKLYASVTNWGEIFTLNCPVCGDLRQRLYISHFSGESVKSKNPGGTFHFGWCYDCKNEHCNLSKYFRQLQIDRTNVIITIKPQAHVSCFSMPSEFPENTIPIISSDVPDYVVQYLHSRRFSPAELNKDFMIRFVPKGTVYRKACEDKPDMCFYEDRLLIPVVQGRRAISWQARRIADVKGDKKKYLFPKGAKKSSWLYNMDNALFHSELVLVEGVTDVWRVGPAAVAIFGKTISTMQLKMMQHLWGFNGSCVIVLDDDAKKNSAVLAQKLRDLKVFPKGVFEVSLAPGCDPANYTREELQVLIEEARVHCY